MRALVGIVLALIAAAWSGLPSRAQTATGPSSPAPATLGPLAPSIEFATPVFDFGRIPAGQVVRHDFVFTNSGAVTLKITEVRPSCGCTAASDWDREVEPGKTGRIPIQLTTTGFGGPIAKSVSVSCNDPARSHLTLQIRGTLWKPIEITPPSAYFTVLRESATNQTKVVRIVSNLDEPLKLSEPECTNQSFQVALQTVKEGKEYELRIAAVPPYPGRMSQAQIRINTSSTATPVLNIPAMVMVQETLTVAPAQLVLPMGPLTNTVQSSVIVRNVGTNVVVLSEPEVNVPGARVQVQETQPGRMFALKVEFPAGYQAKAGEKLELKVKSNHPQYPVLTVPVIARQRVTTLPVLNSSPLPAPRPPAASSASPVAPPPLPQP